MKPDLAEQHQPITDLFSTNDDSQFRLTEEQLQHYAEYGFVQGLRIFDDNQVATLRQELESFFDPNHDGKELWYEYHSNESASADTVLFHALGAWRISPGFHDSLWNRAFTVPASQLLQGAVRFWHDQLFCKPAKHGGVVAWHQDYSYWTRTKPMAHLTCWIGLDDSTIDNGCLQYIPGSHQWDLLPVTGLAGDMDAIREVLTDDQYERFQNPTPILLKAGECAFHHPLLIHGSRENTTASPRRAFVINVMRDGVYSASADELLAGVPPIPVGEKMEGPFFPILYDPSKESQ